MLGRRTALVIGQDHIVQLGNYCYSSTDKKKKTVNKRLL